MQSDRNALDPANRPAMLWAYSLGADVLLAEADWAEALHAACCALAIAAHSTDATLDRLSRAFRAVSAGASRTASKPFDPSIPDMAPDGTMTMRAPLSLPAFGLLQSGMSRA
jgi:hypothetical protein